MINSESKAKAAISEAIAAKCTVSAAAELLKALALPSGDGLNEKEKETLKAIWRDIEESSFNVLCTDWLDKK